ncbi:putative AMP deaminase [Capsicum chinense]|nr:putative AMP deaminase [Capsicum chinense]
MEPWLSPSTSQMQLAIAALFGASVMAISAFYLHKRSVDQVLERLLKLRRKRRRQSSLVGGSDGDDFDFNEDDEIDHVMLNSIDHNNNNNVVVEEDDYDYDDNDSSVLAIYRVSSSMPNVRVSNEWMNEEDSSFDKEVQCAAEKKVLMNSVEKLNSIPSSSSSPRNKSKLVDVKSANFHSQLSHHMNETQLPFMYGLLKKSGWNSVSRTSASYVDLSFAFLIKEAESDLNVRKGVFMIDLYNHHGEERFMSSSNPTMRVESVGKPMTPKISGDSAVETVGNFNEDKSEFAVAAEDVVFSYDNDIGPTEEEFSISALTKSRMHLQHKTVAPEARSNINHDVGEVDRASKHIVENDPSFFNNILPLPATTHESVSVEEEEVLKMIRECLYLREKYVYREEIAPWMKEIVSEPKASDGKHDPFSFGQFEATSHHFKMEDGVVRVYASESDTEELFPVASATTFFTDMHHVLKVMAVGNVRSYCHHRLRFLEEKFRLHLLVNADREFLAQKSAPHRDFYNIRKVDTHVHHSACMNQKHLLRFIKSKLRKEPDEGGKCAIYSFSSKHFICRHDLNVDLLDVHADKSTFHRFDKFNLKYNPCGQSRLREIFLKQDNLIQGRFLAEVTKEVLQDLEASKYQLAEYRISIYGRKQSEWDTLASWFVNNELYSQNAVWLIQVGIMLVM